jgi:hypothetical protein
VLIKGKPPASPCGTERDEIAALAERFKSSPDAFGTAETLHDLDSYAQERLGRRISEAIEEALKARH